jgi:hypothetical protein
MNEQPQLSTRQVAGSPLHALEQHPRDGARNAVTVSVTENWIDEADRLYTTAPAAALGFEIFGRSSKFRGARVRFFSRTTPHIKRDRMMWAGS